MAIVFADKVKVRSYSTGTAEFTLETTVSGFQSFAAIGAGNECYYGIEDAAGNWEVGRGTYDTDSTQELLFRDTVISSSNSNNLVDFPPGGKSVFVTIPSSVASSIVASSASDSFKTIAVAGQSNVIAESATDTLTLVEGNGVTITTNASTDTITIASNPPDRLVNGLNEIVANGSGGITFPNSSVQRDTGTVQCLGNTNTVVYTASGQYQHTIKLLIQVEGFEGSNDIFDTQACEMIIAKSFRANDIAASVYGIVYTGVAPLATFTAEWNSLTNRIEVICTTPSSNSVNVRINATEILTSD